jgi:hypothetical protein
VREIRLGGGEVARQPAGAPQLAGDLIGDARLGEVVQEERRQGGGEGGDDDERQGQAVLDAQDGLVAAG